MPNRPVKLALSPRDARVVAEFLAADSEDITWEATQVARTVRRRVLRLLERLKKTPNPEEPTT